MGLLDHTKQAEIDKIKMVLYVDCGLAIDKAKYCAERMVDCDIGTKDRFEVKMGTEEFEYEEAVQPKSY